MASDLFRLRTVLTPASSKFRRACSTGSASLALAVSLIPFQSLPSLAEIIPEPPQVEAANELVTKSRLSFQASIEAPEATGPDFTSSLETVTSPQVAAPAKILAWATEGSIGETLTSILDHSVRDTPLKSQSLNESKSTTKVAVVNVDLDRYRSVDAVAEEKGVGAEDAEEARAQSEPNVQSETVVTERATSESSSSAATLTSELEAIRSVAQSQASDIPLSGLPLTTGTPSEMDGSPAIDEPQVSMADEPAVIAPQPPLIAATLSESLALAIVPPKAETVDEVQNRLAPGTKALPIPPQVAPVHAGDSPRDVIPTSEFGGALGNSASVYNAPQPAYHLAQAYPQPVYYPQPGYPQGASPQAGYPQAAYPQAYPQPGAYPQPYPQPGYYYPQPVQPGYAPAPQQAYAPYPQAPYYPQPAYPQPVYPQAVYPPQAYVAQPYPQYPQAYQVQPYANPGYAAAYPQPGYPQQAYPAQAYPAQNYAAQPYPQPGYGYPAPGVTTAVQLPPLPAPGSAAPNSRGVYNAGQYNVANTYNNGNYSQGYAQGSPAPANYGQAYANGGYSQPSSIGGRSELPPPPSLTLGDTAFALPAAPRGLSNATSAAVPPQALSEINLDRLPQIPPDPSRLEVPNSTPVAADRIPAGIGGPLDFEAPTLELPPPPLQPRKEVNLPYGEPSPTFRSTALGQPTSQLQAVFLSQGGDSAARARLSGTYPVSPNILFGASFDVASGEGFTDTTNGFSVNEAFASTSLAQLPNLRITAGQMDLTSYFDRNSFAKDSATHFFNPVFQTNPALSAVGLGSRPGVLANWSATDNLDLKVAAYSSSAEIGEFALDGFAGEVGFRKGNAIVRATYASGRDDGSRDSFQEIFNIDRGNGRSGVQKGDREEAYGINGEVFLPNLNAGIFGRYGRYENRDLGESGDSYSLGLSFLDVFTDEDRLGLAFGRNISNDDLRRRFDEDTPNVLELFYDFRFLPNLRMGFTIQERDSFSELAAGFRLKAEFDTLPAGNLSEVR